MDRALELLAERRAKGPAPKKTTPRRRQALTQTSGESIIVRCPGLRIASGRGMFFTLVGADGITVAAAAL